MRSFPCYEGKQTEFPRPAFVSDIGLFTRRDVLSPGSKAPRGSELCWARPEITTRRGLQRRRRMAKRKYKSNEWRHWRAISLTFRDWNSLQNARPRTRHGKGSFLSFNAWKVGDSGPSFGLKNCASAYSPAFRLHFRNFPYSLWPFHFFLAVPRQCSWRDKEKFSRLWRKSGISPRKGFVGPFDQVAWPSDFHA